MPDPIRLIHFADVHVGMENYGRLNAESGLSTRVHDFLRRLDDIIEDGRTNGVDLFILAGDVFKNRSPNPTLQREFGYRVLDMADLAPVVILLGNHDFAPTLTKAYSTEIYRTLRVPNVTIADAYELHQIETARGTVAVAAAPYPVRSLLFEDEAIEARGLRALEQMTVQRVIDKIDVLAAEAAALDMPRVLTGHFMITGALASSEKSLILGTDPHIPLSAVAHPTWDYVAMGHVHQHQNMTAGRDGMPPVVYPGSLERIDFGEAREEKGYARADLVRSATTWRFVPVRARNFVIIPSKLRDSDDPTGDAIADIETHNVRDAVVQVRLELTREKEARLDENLLRDTLRTRGANYIAAIRKDVEREERARLGGSAEGLSDTELLSGYLGSQQQIDEERRVRLMALAEPIFGRAANREQD